MIKLGVLFEIDALCGQLIECDGRIMRFYDDDSVEPCDDIDWLIFETYESGEDDICVDIPFRRYVFV